MKILCWYGDHGEYLALSVSNDGDELQKEADRLNAKEWAKDRTDWVGSGGDPDYGPPKDNSDGKYGSHHVRDIPVWPDVGSGWE